MTLATILLVGQTQEQLKDYVNNFADAVVNALIEVQIIPQVTPQQLERLSVATSIVGTMATASVFDSIRRIGCGNISTGH